jgi:hypothetical protein
VATPSTAYDAHPLTTVAAAGKEQEGASSSATKVLDVLQRMTTQSEPTEDPTEPTGDPTTSEID